MDMLAGRAPPPPELVFHHRSEYLDFLKKQEEAVSVMYHHRSDGHAANAVEVRCERATAAVSPVVPSRAIELRSCSDCPSLSTPSTTPPPPQLFVPKPIRLRGNGQKTFVPLEQVEAAIVLRHDISACQKEFEELCARYFKLLPHTRERAEVGEDHRRICKLHLDGNAANPLSGEALSFVQKLERVESDIEYLERSFHPGKRVERLQEEIGGVRNLLQWITEAVEGYERAAPVLVHSMLTYWESGINVYEKMYGLIAGDDWKLRELGDWLEQIQGKQS